MKINLDKTGFFVNFLDSPVLLEGHNLVTNELVDGGGRDPHTPRPNFFHLCSFSINVAKMLFRHRMKNPGLVSLMWCNSWGHVVDIITADLDIDSTRIPYPTMFQIIVL